jgi:endonuclease YncB( thermonuclease family)
MFVKALHCRAFFIVSLCCACLPLPVFADCAPVGKGEDVSVAYVYDGDTLLLEDDRKVRLIGINTPEMGRDDAPDEPFAHEARQALQSLVAENQGRLRLIPGQQAKDRYRRLLAHLYDEQGTNITASLLRSGAGFAITIPPNLKHLDCYHGAEASAREALLGIWNLQPVMEGGALKQRETGFRLIRGEVNAVVKRRGAIWLKLRDGPMLRIDRDDWNYFSDWDLYRFVGRSLEARGWITRYKGEQRLHIRHPSAISWQD